MKTAHLLSRSKRQAHRTRRWLITIAAVASVVFYIVLANIEPDAENKPTVTVYMQESCNHCREWADYLAGRGFRILPGDPSDWDVVRTQCKVPRAFQTPLTAMVKGYCVQGFVPASDIHSLLNLKFDKSVRGLVVPGMPRGAPGVDAGFPEPFAVYAMLAHGLLRPIATYNEPLH